MDNSQNHCIGKYPDCDRELKVGVRARGVIPQKVSELENDVPYASEPWVKRQIRDHSCGPLSFDGGNIKNKTEIRFNLDCGDISNPVKEEIVIFDGGSIDG